MKHEILSLSLSAVLVCPAFSAFAGTGDGDAEPNSAVLRDIGREMDAADDDAALSLLPDAEKRIRARLEELDAAPSAGTAAERAELTEALADLKELQNDLVLLPGGSYFDEGGGGLITGLVSNVFAGLPEIGGSEPVTPLRDTIQPVPIRVSLTFDEWLKKAQEQADAAVEESERADEIAAEAEEEHIRKTGSQASGTPVRGGSADGFRLSSRGPGAPPATRGGAGESAPSDTTSPVAGIGDAIDEVAFTNLVWQFGGVDASGAVPDGPAIQMLRCSAEEMSFDWVRDLSCWGLAHDDAAALACLFVQTADDEWIGGKFEWISSSRNRRSFENVFEGYNGWNLAGVPRSAMVAFVVVSRDGSRRSNVISALWER